MPGTDVERVVPLSGRARCRAEIREVAGAVEVAAVAARASAGQKLVIADRGVSDRLVLPPAEVVRLPEGCEPAAVVLVVAQQEHRSDSSQFRGGRGLSACV